VNPNGWRGFLYPFRIFSDYAVPITENASPTEYWRTVLNPMLLALPCLTVMTVAAAALILRDAYARRRVPDRTDAGTVRPANLMIAVASIAAAWTMARSAPLLALASLPVIGAVRLPVPRPVPFRFRRVAARTLALTVVALDLWLCGAVVSGAYARVWPSPIGPTPFGFDDPGRYTRLRTLADQHGLHGPVFNDYNIGSLVEYQLDPEPAYVDNRPEAFPGDFWRNEYHPALALDHRWTQIRDRRRFNTIVVALTGVKERFCQELMRRPEWVLVHLDALCGVWVRNTAENRTVIDGCAMDATRFDAFVRETSERLLRLPDVPCWRRQTEADRVVYRLYALVCVGQGYRAWPYILQMHRLYPEYQIVHELMRVTAPPEQYAIVADVLKRRARWPVAAKQVLDRGWYLVRNGETREARRVFRRGRRFFPLSPALKQGVPALQPHPTRDRSGRSD